jgi:hypothetical protein
MKYRDIVGNRKKILIELIVRHNKNNIDDKITNFASVEILNEEIKNDKLKISFNDKNQIGKIFSTEIDIWDIILNIL